MRSKLIVINNKRDYDTFIRKIKYYKMFFYFGTFFVVENNLKKDDVDVVIKALNMKVRKKRIDYVYDETCRMIDDSVKCINICGFKNKQCYVQRKLKNGMVNGCCRKCVYQTDNGCSTKNLACKLFNCSEVKSRHKMMNYDDLVVLKVLSLKNQFMVKSDYFSKREDVLKDLYSYSLIYSTIRIVYRLIRNMICFSVKIKNRKN